MHMPLQELFSSIINYKQLLPWGRHYHHWFIILRIALAMLLTSILSVNIWFCFEYQCCCVNTEQIWTQYKHFCVHLGSLHQWSYIGCQNSDSASSSKFHHLALLVVLVSHSSNFHHWHLLALLVALVKH